MSFLNPGAWLLAVLAVLIAAVYFWRYPVRKQTTATLWLWQRALARRPAWYALRFWLSLAAQIVILLLMVAALAGPYWTEAANSRRTIVMLLDVSASMSAGDGSATRFDRMQQEAHRIAAGLQRHEQMAMISVGSIVRNVCRWTDNRELLAASIDSLRPTDGTTRMEEAVHLARRMLADRQNPSMVILTDGGFPEADALPAAEDVVMTVLHSQSDNAAITRFASRPRVADPQIHDVLVEVANFGQKPVACSLEVGLQDQTAQSVPLQRGGGQSQQVSLSVPVEQSGLMRARLLTADSLPADDRAVALVHPRQRIGVLLLSDLQTAVDRQLQTALEAGTYWDLAASDNLPSDLPDRTVVVLHATVPDPLPPCPLLVIDPQNDCPLWTIRGTIEGESSTVGKSKSMSPLLDGVRFDDVVVEQAVLLNFRDVPATTLVESDSGEPLYSLLTRPEGDVLVLHVPLQREKSDLSMRSDFTTLLHNAVRWLVRESQPAMMAVTTGQVVEVPDARKPLRLKTQDGSEMVLQADQTVANLDRVGVWTVSAGGEETAADLVLPCNLAERSESDLGRGADLPSRKFETSVEESRPLWVFLIGAAMLCLVLQWCFYHRWMVV